MTAAIHQEVVFKASPAKLYNALMKSEQHSEFTKSPAEISEDPGGSFSCHDGQIVGRNIELIPNKRIVQAWRVNAWEEGVYSTVKIELEEEGSQTKLIMDHFGVAPEFEEHISGGWFARYWEPLKDYLS